MPFRNKNNPKAKSITKSMQEEAYKITKIYPKWTSILTLNPNGIKQNMSELDFSWPLLFSKEVTGILQREIKIVTNLEEARIFIPEDECWNTHYSNITRLHSYLPQVYQRLPDYKKNFDKKWLRPLFSQSKLACHRGKKYVL